LSVADKAARALARRFLRELGKRGARLVVRRITRVALKELAEGLLPKVEQHILEHAEEVVAKATHTVFKAGLGKDQILALIKETIKKGGAPVLSEMSESGAFAFVIEKEFSQEIGSAGQKILRVVVDREGRVVTAFAVNKLLERVAIKGLLVSAQLAVVIFMLSILEAEAEAAESDTRRRYKRIADDQSWFETGLEWLGPFGLFESTLIGLEPNFDQIAARTNLALMAAAKELNRPLTAEEQAVIRQAIYDVWADAVITGRP
jgi:hypothetical protein